MTRDHVGNALFGISITLAIVGLTTLVPFSASKVNDLGYHSICPFAPWSTLALLVAAGAVWAVRGYVMTRA